MFGSQFFGLDTSEDPPKLRIARDDYWIFWVVVVGVSVSVFLMAFIVRGLRIGKWARWQQNLTPEIKKTLQLMADSTSRC
ncbi:hypothetical protein V8E54_014595 [Elaphomyces granulatus]|jgi:hypothetical protein